jgi:hypothetical protein
MRSVILVIIIVLGLSAFVPAILAKQPFLLSSSIEDGNPSDSKITPTEADARFTPSIDEFLDDNLSLNDAKFLSSQNNQITPSIGIFMSDRKLSSKYLDTKLESTSFLDAFLNDNWLPSSYTPPTYTAPYPNKQNISLNSSNLTNDILNNTFSSPSRSLENIYGPNEIGYQESFLDPSWTPSDSAKLNPQPDVPFKKHVMN